ncbi:ammonia-dependent NAD(+) synthetase [Brevibacillus laterosporus]|uniref:NH(3)-dependent NAD(+) synthetase n=1 Tax=Brevibacillus laterosporus TaxID=1465 RepID=A0AAP3DFP1_BRELA|nr:ammonia-dependent NAD(+) synthetase [Brevibacillus laterosporus]MCR8979104.1 ammonia-dependent NAD(+) synthetase [Brevibacillus laterosporus]MCZ0806260.1 ammonia-dependent NAD(+) synthetase [Brevibacillus laterosporus]MCZ0824706.1 ammonia-dependent NAD(+) synthetase [Brevibacillus laterosporus]MCZ0848526.1 ammonia-dependent NAD(+) synthetase [Brevibacillus laterosporus]MED1663156.1 ammonia-dependent NAD(+) synthetase [Brevibacillus laterosporus]
MRQKQIQAELDVQPTIDPQQEIRSRVEFLKEYLLATHTKGYVLGISGGQDSSLAGRLAQLAVEEIRQETGKDYSFIAVRLPYGVQQDEDDAQRALAFIKPDRTVAVNIKPAVDASVQAFEEATGEQLSHFLKGNIKARERMKVQYDLGAHYQLLVIGTDHAAEAVTGFFTKFGDGGCDVTPLTGLSKRQGKQLLQALGAEEALYVKIPTADLEDDKPLLPDETALGMSYDQLDDYLEGESVPGHIAEKIDQRFLRTAHKRHLPVTPFDTWWKEQK